MQAQRPNTGSLEQVLRALKALALSPAFPLEVGLVAYHMGQGAFSPGQFVDANGALFTLSLDDEQFGDPAAWLQRTFRKVQITQQLRPVPPYPHLELFGAPGHQQQADHSPFEVDSGQVAGWSYRIDAVTVAQADRPEIAARRAMAMMQAFERLVRRNQHLGGLVQLIAADGPPAPGGEVEHGKLGLISGVAQRFQVEVLSGIL